MKDQTKIRRFIDSNLDEFKEYLEPRSYILGMGDAVDREMVVRYLQNMLRAVLVYFVNGCY